jgi:hypothetical protein
MLGPREFGRVHDPEKVAIGRGEVLLEAGMAPQGTGSVTFHSLASDEIFPVRPAGIA